MNGLALALASACVIPAGFQPALSTKIEVHKSKSCTCCLKWVALLPAGLRPVVFDEADVNSTKDRLKVPRKLRSCHTTVAGSYVFEGHVPIDLVIKVLEERPKIAGLAVPGMPVGSPGMEQAGRKASYEVIGFDDNGNQTVYARR